MQAGTCDAIGLTLFFKGGHPAEITFGHSSSKCTFMISSCEFNGKLKATRSEVTKDQFWQRPTGLPELEDARLNLNSAVVASHDDLKALGKGLFTILCKGYGKLQFDLVQSAAGAHSFDYSGEPGYILVTHRSPETGHFMQLSSTARKCLNKMLAIPEWEIDNVPCIVSPPCLHFDDMPRAITAVRATVRSLSSDFATDFYSSLSTDTAVRDFAYTGNINTDTIA